MLIKKQYPTKVEFKEIGEVTSEELTRARQAMLEQTKADWILVLDGDEVWWQKPLIDLLKLIQDKGVESAVCGYYNLIGDTFNCFSGIPKLLP